MKRIYLSKRSLETKILGQKLARAVLISGPKQESALVIALQGELGSGKTTFLQGFARGLGIKEKVLSPTFVLIRKFKIPSFGVVSRSVSPGFAYFYHIDCYRINKPKEILSLGFKEINANPKNILAIEWADRVKKIFPKRIMKINFKFISKNTRQLTIRSDRFDSL